MALLAVSNRASCLLEELGEISPSSLQVKSNLGGLPKNQLEPPFATCKSAGVSASACRMHRQCIDRVLANVHREVIENWKLVVGRVFKDDPADDYRSGNGGDDGEKTRGEGDR
ncbi:hypothetical protein HN011_001655 [Eciton burchellii]|jgi:hypothetical protein|nr:hypothetical protein HN011_001655 [Eciton burchellii]